MVVAEPDLAQCDGTRPVCQRCRDRGFSLCHYSTAPNESRTVALNRKLKTSQQESAQAHRFLALLVSLPENLAFDLCQQFRLAPSLQLEDRFDEILSG